ncbi:hypothetical protein PpBr36_01805 [Pyricularia pennisetigena]|uniref:hypothetical protein n=1 Tax=Pyricularia pennisetigena TaxID=1578925 RepID=UPI0011534134|nr:hypothetical protein PpBr36_01805 [Pyricularia pennisetigena]TLS28971.1 hypothetical protein PpBr36_01805 [Pyricularia pennisetigena]
MSGNATLDVNEVHSLIDEVNSWHQPTDPPVEPGWSEPRRGADDAETRTDDSGGTLTAQQNDEYKYYTAPTGQDADVYSGYGGGETGEDNNDDDLDEQERTRGPLLVCEFRDLCNCREVFDRDETEAWIQHISGDHLGYNCPAKSVCWFCDRRVFNGDVDRKGRRIKTTTTTTTTTGEGDGEDNERRERRAYAFRQRLEHVAWHITEEGRFRYYNMRPDFSLMKHMHKHGMLDDETYDFATAYRELPPPPPSHKPKKQKEIKTNPPDWEQPHKILERERKSQIIYDQSKEDRQRKKEKDAKRREEGRKSKK